MPWFCPKCERPFKNRNQYHSCVNVDIESLFKNKNPVVKKIYNRIALTAKKCGKDVLETASLNAIFMKAPATFLAIKPLKNSAGLEFLLDEEIMEFPISKTLRVSKNRVAHFVQVEHLKEVDSQLLDWIKKAYQTIKKSKRK